MGYVVEKTSLSGGPALAIRETLPMSELPAFFGKAFQELMEAAHRGGACIVAPPFARYFSVTPQAVEVEAVMPLDIAVGRSGRAVPQLLAKGEAIQVKHTGPYDAMQPAYGAIQQWLASHHARAAEPPREVYLTSPVEVPDPQGWQTMIVQPLG